MRTLNWLVLIFLAAYWLIMTFCLLGCKSTKPDKSHSYDSTTVKYTPRDTTIKVPVDSASLSAKLPCPEVNWQGKAKSGRISLDASIKNGDLRITCKTDSLIARIKLLEKETERRTGKTETYTKILTVAPWYVKPLLWFSAFMLLGFLIKHRKAIGGIFMGVFKFFV